ncbi:hypothetical protein [Staphylococcus aureus]|uniref:hypothetical protein n=1 Tax=Staphylococcus aureus TaxID=1280 RepID=UPI001BFEA66F|nr:hypothetical protein [Staphylococcus aureus]
MRTIINIDDTNFKYLNAYSKQMNTSIDNIVNDLISTHITKINEHYSNIDLREINDFARIMQKYFHEDLEDMFSLIDSDEEVTTDKPMINVYKKLYQDISLRDGTLLELFEEFKKN